MNRYRVLLPLTVHTEDGSYTQGEEFDKDFSEEDEAENLRSGLLEIVPREYRVIGDSSVHEAAPGETFTAALPIGNEALLVDGGFIERAGELPPLSPEPVKPKRKRAKASSR